LKNLLIIILLGFIELGAFNFKSPPASVEVMEPSVLGDEVEADENQPVHQNKKKIVIEENEFDDFKKDNKRASNIYVEHREEFDTSHLDKIDYPKIALMVPRNVIKKY